MSVEMMSEKCYLAFSYDLSKPIYSLSTSCVTSEIQYSEYLYENKKK
jgi:hypothetical protein